MRVDRIEGHSFLAPVTRAIDLGLNRGRFATDLIERYGTEVTGVEPVPVLFERLPEHPRLTPIAAAIHPGKTATLYLSTSGAQDDASVLSTLASPAAATVQVRAVTLSDLLVQPVDLVKVDIEGAEIEMFLSTPADVLRRAKQYSVEFHDFLDSALDPKPAMRRLRELGFWQINFSRDNSDVLFIRPTPPLHSRLLLRFTKYRLGIARLIARRSGGARKLAHRLRGTASMLGSRPR